MTESGKWMESLSVQITSDTHISGKHGFLLWQQDLDPDAAFFESGFVYSSRDDAQTAGDDAAHAAWLFRNLED